MIPLYRRARKLSKKSGLTLAALKANTIDLITKRGLVLIILFTVLGLGGVFAASLITVTAADSQGAGYLAATSCDESIAINKDVVFNSSTKRFQVATISVSGVDQRYDANGINGCGNKVLEMVFPINGSPTYTSWYIPSSSVSGSNTFIYGSDNTGEYQSDSIITPFDVTDLSGVAVRILAGFENSPCIIGKSAVCPATSPQEIYNLYGTTTNGTFYIKVNGVATQVYLMMNRTGSDNGAWILLMKGAKGTTNFNYNSNNFLLNSTTLNASSLADNVTSDAKYSVYNNLTLSKMLAVLKDPATGSVGSYGDIQDNAFGGHVWLETLPSASTAYTRLTTTLALNSLANYSYTSVPKTKYLRSSPSGNQVFSYQAGYGLYGFNSDICAGTANRYRWGISWNQEADFNSCDVVVGIGLGGTSQNSPGDQVRWSGVTNGSVTSNTGHGNMGFQIWGKVAEPSLNGVQSLAATASGSTAAITWSAPSGVTPTDYVVQYKTSTESRYTNAKIVTGQTSTSITGLSAATSYNFRVFARTSSDSTAVATAVTLAIA